MISGRGAVAVKTCEGNKDYGPVMWNRVVWYMGRNVSENSLASHLKGTESAIRGSKLLVEIGDDRQ